MPDLALRVPSVDELFDGWSLDPLSRRPLSDEVRERILDLWGTARKAATGAPTLELHLPEAERGDGLDETIAGAVHSDMERLAVDSRHQWIRRALRPRAAHVGLGLFFLALTIAAIIDFTWSDQGGESLIGQTFVVFAWVALWTPASAMIQPTSYRLARKRFIELAEAGVRIVWD